MAEIQNNILEGHYSTQAKVRRPNRMAAEAAGIPKFIFVSDPRNK